MSIAACLAGVFSLEDALFLVGQLDRLDALASFFGPIGGEFHFAQGGQRRPGYVAGKGGEPAVGVATKAAPVGGLIAHRRGPAGGFGRQVARVPAK
jgi:hypothetical protein